MQGWFYPSIYVRDLVTWYNSTTEQNSGFRKSLTSAKSKELYGQNRRRQYFRHLN